MAKEQVMNDPLCGAERKMIIMARIADALDKDCTLVDDITYADFGFSFEIKIHSPRSPSADTLMWADGLKGAEVTGTVKGEYLNDQPNVARNEHDLPLPVMVQTPSGPQRRKVRFQKPEAYAKK